MKSQKTSTIQDRRKGQDRRNWECQHAFPYIDGHGELVVDDRRKSSDRRLLADQQETSQSK